jgi:hypothetical protein
VTDHLGQLVLRIRQTDLALEPRLASRFEPPRQLAVDPSALRFPPEPISPAWPEANVAPRDPVHAPPDRLLGYQRGRDIVEGIAEPGSADERPSETHHGTPAVARPRIAARRVREPDADKAQGAREAPHPLPAPRAPAVVWSGREREMPVSPRERVRNGQSASEATITPRQSTAPIEIDRAVRRLAAREPERPPLRDGVVIESTQRVEPVRPPATSPAPQTREQSARPEPVFAPRVSKPDATASIEPPSVAEGPTIHVTIGRVEIRAAVPAPTVRRTQPRPPALSLEQYLKQRKGAGA